MKLINAQVCERLRVPFMHGLQVTDNNFTIVDTTS